MKAFHLERKMMSFLGDFYPTGNLFIMFPTEAHARRAEALLVKDGHDSSTMSLLTPDDVLGIVHLFDNRDFWLPSVGTEERTARHFGDLARAGHYALLVPVRDVRHCEKVMAALKDAGVSCAVRYRHLVIEDLVE
ncbi:MAG: RNA-binding protein [Ramlibacter sp.]